MARVSGDDNGTRRFGFISKANRFSSPMTFLSSVDSGFKFQCIEIFMKMTEKFSLDLLLFITTTNLRRIY